VTAIKSQAEEYDFMLLTLAMSAQMQCPNIRDFMEGISLRPGTF
jgi:hypothetical protein